MSEAVASRLAALLLGRERPRMKELLAELESQCVRAGERVPSRATVYQFMARVATPEHRVGDLPGPVRAALYNLEDDSRVPEAQIAFYCFNYGDASAMSFAAGLRWLSLYQAVRMRGWRPKSKGALMAAMRARRS
jgi:hypothetical protein